MKVDFCPVLCIPKVAILQAFRSISHFVWYCKAVSDLCTNVNAYLIPNLIYKSGKQMEQLGKYGFLRRDYLKNHKNSLYQVMLLQDTIGEHLLEVDKAAREREEVILKQLEEKEPLPDKEADQMAWVRAANQHSAIAEEIILRELIYI